MPPVPPFIADIWRRRPALLAIGVPTLLVFLYLVMIARPGYDSTVSLIIREARADGSSPGLLAGLFNPAAQASREEAFILADFLHSADFIEKADDALGLRAHYSAPALDLPRRLSGRASAEDFHDYVRDRLVVAIDPDSGITTVTVRTFDRELSRRLANLVVAESENAINQLNRRLIEARTALAQKELELARDALDRSRRDLLAFQVANQVADPASDYGSRVGGLAGLEGRLMDRRSQLKIKEAYLRDDSFELRSLRQEIAALEAQRATETAGLIGEGGRSVAATAADYAELKSRAEFALHAYTSAVAVAEQSRLNAARQEKFLLLITPPALPDEAAFPQLFWNTATAFVLIASLYGVARLTLATIRDHSL